jgi:hypothetical protein
MREFARLADNSAGIEVTRRHSAAAGASRGRTELFRLPPGPPISFFLRYERMNQNNLSGVT